MNEVPKIKILVDAMFGKLGKFLRLMGFDTEFADNEWPDPVVMQHCIEQKRMLITRDEEFYRIASENYEKNDISLKLLFIHHQDLEHQLAKVFTYLGMNPSEFDWDGPDRQIFDSRCSICNSILNKMNKNEIRDHISEGTAKMYENFWQCSNPECKHVFWVGSAHWDDIVKKIQAASELMKLS